MVSNVDEIEFARRELETARAALRDAGRDVAPNIEFGVMIETPAAALIADVIAPRVDFLSIGTNDLLQYTLAVDRTNEHVAYLYEPLHPANLRLLQQVCQAARREGILVSMCGEMAGDPLNCWILMALGVGELSMAPFSIPLIKKILRQSTAAEARDLLATVLRMGSGQEIRACVETHMRGRFPAEFEGLRASG